MAQPLKIFINYRRADNPHFVELIRTHLALRYGRDNVFMDFDNLPRFTQFADFIRQQIQQSDVVITMIGPRWLDLLEERAARPDIDYVRLEIEEALKHHKLIAPILILDADVPPETRLPESMRPMLRSNIARIRDGRELWNEIDSLVADLEAELVRRGYAPFDASSQSEAAQALIASGRTPTDADSSAIYQRMAASFQAGDWDAAVVWASKLSLDEGSLPPAVLSQVKRMEAQARAEIERENERRRNQEAAAYLYRFVQADFAANSPASQTRALLGVVHKIAPDYDPDGIAEKLMTRAREKKSAKPAPRPVAPKPKTIPTAKTPFMEGRGWLMGAIGVIAVLLVAGVLLSGVLSGDGSNAGRENISLEAAMARAEAGVSANADWEPFVQSFDGYEMALVPAGCFRMGSDDGESDEQPVHEVCFEEPFWIDVYEVTNVQYGGRSSSGSCFDESFMDDQPRNCVSWYDAQAFCEGRGGSLPSEAQWEYAARGPSNWIYPWGDDFEGDNAVYNTSQTALVGSRPGGVSWVGAYHMAGNLWEWTTTIYDQDQFPYPYSFTDGRDDTNRTDVQYRVLRGGPFNGTLDHLRGAFRIRDFPDDESDNGGFRCAR